MKQITVSDEDYKTIMELSRELQSQENDSQNFPYFWSWSPRSTKWGIGTDAGDDEKVFYLDGGVATAEELFNDKEGLRLGFINKERDPKDVMIKDPKFSDIDLDSWEDFLEERGYAAHYRREEEVSENNFSLFKSDVKTHIKWNSHHLGSKPHIYANIIFRMPKMQKLIECFYRLNPQKDEDINPEDKRFVKGEGE